MLSIKQSKVYIVIKVFRFQVVFPFLKMCFHCVGILFWNLTLQGVVHAPLFGGWFQQYTVDPKGREV